MKLSELVTSVDQATTYGALDHDITAVSDDTRSLEPGALFVAVKGAQSDGHRYVAQAARARAAAIVVETGHQAADLAAQFRIPIIEVPDSRRFLGILADRFYAHPSSRLRMIGVTGTNGKTTATYLCKAMLESTGMRLGLIGTVVYVVGDVLIPAHHTTPGALELQSLLRRMADAGMDSVVMEVSSHALALDRTVGCNFETVVFTNLTQDHLDFHADMEDYFQAKLRLFKQVRSRGRAIVNVDDPYGERVASVSRAPVWTYAVERAADLRGKGIRVSLSGVEFTIETPFGASDISSPLVGRHNVYNLLATIGVGLHYGLSLSIIKTGLSRLAKVPGRFERIDCGQPFTVVVDYAHTEDALFRLLSTVQEVKTGKVITVFGCGGDRDRGKRPKMGRVAAKYSDLVVVTSDNPRTEDPLAIIREVEPGVKAGLQETGKGRYVVYPDRRKAIEEAIRQARPDDVVVIAGKGHENYQVVGETKQPFDDRIVARETIEALGK